MAGYLDREDGSGHLAFRRLTPVSPSYATTPITDGFNWAEIADEVGPGEWYLVAFRSVRRPTADEAKLLAYDDRAHEEAMRAPGFVHYFPGLLNERRECLSFCIWESPDQARAAGQLPAHRAAIELADEAYESYELEFYGLRRRPGSGGFEFEALGSRRAH